MCVAPLVPMRRRHCHPTRRVMTTAPPPWSPVSLVAVVVASLALMSSSRVCASGEEAIDNNAAPSSSFRATLGDFCAPGNNKHLRQALKHRSDEGKNIVLAVSNGADSPPFVEMTKWFVRDMERTGTPYLFMAMSEEQCHSIENTIEEALAWNPPEGWAGPDPRASSSSASSGVDDNNYNGGKGGGGGEGGGGGGGTVFSPRRHILAAARQDNVSDVGAVGEDDDARERFGLRSRLSTTRRALQQDDAQPQATVWGRWIVGGRGGAHSCTSVHKHRDV